MSQGSSDYPISRLIALIITDSGLRRSEFVQAIGYKNAAKGLRRLDEWLQNGSGDEGCLQRMVDALHPDPAELEHALAETETFGAMPRSFHLLWANGEVDCQQSSVSVEELCSPRPIGMYSNRPLGIHIASGTFRARVTARS